MGGTRGELVPARESAEREARVGISAEMTARQRGYTRGTSSPCKSAECVSTSRHLRRDDGAIKGIYKGNRFLGGKGTGLRPPAGGLDLCPASLSALTGVSLPAFSALRDTNNSRPQVVKFLGEPAAMCARRTTRFY